MKKKLKNFITKKGGIYAILITTGLVLTALILMAVGFVYGSLGGDWNKLWEWFGQPFAISIYVILFLVIFALTIIGVLIKRNEEIK